MAERITVRLDDEVYGRLADAAKARGTDVSSVVRQAVIADLDGVSRIAPTAPPPHDREACAQAILTGCPSEVQHEVSTRITRVGLPLAHWLGALLLLSVAPFVDQAEQQGVELPTLLHQALVMLLDRASRTHHPAGSPHSPEDCAAVVVAHCPPTVQARMAEAMARTGAPLMRLLPDILQFWTDATRNPRAWSPDR
jgi:Ribbon-helix-helix protein, copG family